LESIDPAPTLVSKVYDSILDAICDMTLKPGDRITQEDIAQRLNVSRQPVTHALSMLKARGFLVEAGRRGLSVAPVDPKLFADIYRFRSAVEPLAVELAIPRLTDSAISRGRDLIARGSAAVVTGDSRAVLQADIDFHSFIYQLSDNAMIAETLQLNWQHLRRSMGVVLHYPGLSIQVWHEHAAILEAMIRGDTEAAVHAMRQHILGAYQRVSTTESSTLQQAS
jgi:DNA-binding GntR family transcriptional regulator